jgi:2-polyprenyl-6-methoxyphenol hydroxylase-like FAD-dependent oxidoreductase
MMSSYIANRALVIGAGMAGLAAAGALSNHFEQVLVLDRDQIPGEPAHRTGTPQARHAHVLLAGGLRALAELFPGFVDSLTEAGAVSIEFNRDFRIERLGFDPFPRREFGIHMLASTRPLLEFVTRRRLAERRNVAVRQNCRVQAIIASPDGARVTGVRCDTEGVIETLDADLVVDASGRGNLIRDCLLANGYDAPEETIIGMDAGYSTMIFDIPGEPLDFLGVNHFATAPDSGRGAVMLPCEGNRWIVSLLGMHGDKPPGEWGDFLAYAKSLRTRTVYDVIFNAERVGEIHRYALPESVHRHFERLERFPDGLLPLGDSMCRFNPIFGQGMSVGALEAVTLHKLLSENSHEDNALNALVPVYFAAASDLIQTPWSTAILDFVYPETTGVRPPDLENSFEFVAALFRLAARDPDVHRLFTEVQQLLKPNSVFQDPDFAERVNAEIAEPR